MGKLDDLLLSASGDKDRLGFDSTSLLECNLTGEESDIQILDWLFTKLVDYMGKDKLTFQGGYVLTKILPDTMVRATTDIDFNVIKKEYINDVLEFMKLVVNTLLDKKIVSDHRIRYGDANDITYGLKMIRSSNGSRKIGFDIGLCTYTTGLISTNINDKEVQIYSVERMLSDKISAMYSRVRGRRTKDLYDIYLLSEKFDINMIKLGELIEVHGGLSCEDSPCSEEAIEVLRKGYESLKVLSIRDKNIELSKPSFIDVFNRLGTLVSAIGRPYIWRCSCGGFVDDI